MLTGFDELILRCGSEASRSHIIEAVRCYESGAYRAAILTTYIAVCFDLIEKLKVLSSQGDGQATGLITMLEGLRDRIDRNDLTALAGILRFERNLLEEFRDKFDFFGQHEFEELSRLRADRNRCAHPSFEKSSLPYSPSAELARLHIRNALVLVLSQEPKQGKAALASLRSVVLSKYFPDDLAEAVTRLRATELSQARPALVRAFVDDIIFGVPDPASQYHGKAVAITALAAVIELKRELALPRAIAGIDKLLASGDDDTVQFASAAALRIAEIAEQLNDASRAVMRGWVAREGADNLVHLVRRALAIEWVRPDAMARIPDLTAEHYAKLSGDAPPEILTRAAEIYGSVGSWDEANRVAVNCAIPFVDKFSEADIRHVFQRAADGLADLRGSHSFREFIRGLSQSNPLGKARVHALLEEYGMEFYIEPPEEAAEVQGEAGEPAP